MTRLILARLIQLPVILGIIFVVTCELLIQTPGNPFDSNPDRPLDPQVEKLLKEQWKFDDRWGFMGAYLERVFTEGSFGPSLKYKGRNVGDIIREGLPKSAAVGVFALIAALAMGLAAGVIGALRPGSVLDSSSLALAVVGVSLPSFVTASILLTIFTGLLHWLPATGWGQLNQMILPAIALGAAPAAYIARLVRLGLAEVMNSDFIRTARAKGLSRTSALFNHAMKVAFLPVLSFLGPAAATTLTGSFVIERVFAIPGLGEHFVNAVLNNDRFLVLGLVLVYSTILVVFNLVVDVAYAFVDPRIEL